MKLFDIFSFKSLIIICIIIFICIFFIYSNHISYSTESFEESTEYLNNPYQGFYHIMGYTLSTHYDPTTTIYQTDSYSDSLALLEINLKEYRLTDIDQNGLNQLNDIFAAWSKSPYHTQLIVRFLYDWDGVALSTEPESLDLILKHMDQISSIVNQHKDIIYIMQGVFIGNWGEMHHSRFIDNDSIKTLIEHLNEVIDPSIYLSVRTPAQWRMINNLYDIPTSFPTNDSLMTRLGLFNDGILGSESDLGTYGNTPRSQATSPSYQGTRDEELEFQKKLCQYVPNGGEVIYNHTMNQLETSVSSLQKMHISYLNADYDKRVYELWKQSSWTKRDNFYGSDGYNYIKTHIGYRYLINKCQINKEGFFNPQYKLKLTIQNNGFSSTLQPFLTSIQLENEDTGQLTSIDFNADLRKLDSEQKKSFTVILPVKDLEHGHYQIYLLIKDQTTNQTILLANKNKLTQNGYLLGQLDI